VPNQSTPDAARAFAESLARRDYQTAAAELSAVHADNPRQAAALLRLTLEAVAAEGQRCGTVTVTQTAHTVEAGATQIGLKVDRIG
jgi:hypothetical protein